MKDALFFVCLAYNSNFLATFATLDVGKINTDKNTSVAIRQKDCRKEDLFLSEKKENRH
jgi:hypothetical protein